MDKELYDKEVACPICRNKFSTKKVRTSAIRTLKRDTDFCVHYKTVNPYLYGVWVCPKCGYAATENKFNSLKKIQNDIIKENITKYWIKREYGDKRSIDSAIVVYKLALYEGNLLEWEKSYIGGLCLKIAWLYRYKENEEAEYRFLQHALECFDYAFSKERFPIAGMDTATLAYLVGELNRKLEKYEEAISWFQRSLKDPQIKGKRLLENMTREQWRLAAEEYKKIKGEVENDLSL